MSSIDDQINQLKETIHLLNKQLKRLEIEKKCKQLPIEQPLKKGDRVRILTTTKFGRKNDIAIVQKVNKVQCSLKIIETGEFVVRNISSVIKV